MKTKKKTKPLVNKAQEAAWQYLGKFMFDIYDADIPLDDYQDFRWGCWSLRV